MPTKTIITLKKKELKKKPKFITVLEAKIEAMNL
jgi:hypothetical protein